MTKMLIVSFVSAMLVGAYLVYASTQSSIDFRHIEKAFDECSAGKNVQQEKAAIIACMDESKANFPGVKNLGAYTSKGEGDFYKDAYLAIGYTTSWATGYCWISDSSKLYCRKAAW